MSLVGGSLVGVGAGELEGGADEFSWGGGGGEFDEVDC